MVTTGTLRFSGRIRCPSVFPGIVISIPSTPFAIIYSTYSFVLSRFSSKLKNETEYP